MQSLRLLGRVAPRSIARTPALRSISSISRTVSLRPTWQSIRKPADPAFSMSIARREPAGDSDQLLAEKLKQERSLEIESKDVNAIPESCKEYLETHSWSILDTPGNHKVILTKDFGNENIKVEFSINDLMDGPEETEDLEDDMALADEDLDEKRTINQSGVKGGKVDVMPEDSIAPADRDEALDDAAAAAAADYPVYLNVTITKPGNKTVEITALAQEGTIIIQQLTNTAVTDANRDSVYTGPAMDTLDADLQAMFEQYLEERGIDGSLSTFAVDYNEFKEQREYVDWLQQFQDFVEA